MEQQPARRNFLNLNDSQRKILFTTIAIGLSIFFTREATLVIFLLAPIQFIHNKYGLKTMILAAVIGFIGVMPSIIQQLLALGSVIGMDIDVRTIIEAGLIILGLFLGLVLLNVRSYRGFKPRAWMRISFASLTIFVLAIPSFISLSQPELYDQVLLVMSGQVPTEDLNLGLIPFENQAEMQASFSTIATWVPRLLNLGWLLFVMINWYYP